MEEEEEEEEEEEGERPASIKEFLKGWQKLLEKERSCEHPVQVFLQRPALKGKDETKLHKQLLHFSAQYTRAQDSIGKERSKLKGRINRIRAAVQDFIALSHQLAQHNNGTHKPAGSGPDLNTNGSFGSGSVPLEDHREAQHSEASAHHTHVHMHPRVPLPSRVSARELLSRVQASMEHVEDSLSQFKQRQMGTYDALLKDEVALGEEMRRARARFQQWRRQDERRERERKERMKQRRRQLRLKAKRAADHVHRRLIPGDDTGAATTTPRPPEVVEYQAYVADHGGLRGGWTEYDHNVFLRHRRKHKGDSEALAMAVADELLGKTARDVRDHNTWYTELLRRKCAYKHAIAKWREEQRGERAQRAAAADALEADARAARQEHRRRRAEEERRRRAAQAREVTQWREAQQQRRRRAEAEAQRQQRAEEERRRREEQGRQRALRRQVQSYKQTRAAEARAREEAERKRKEAEAQAAKPSRGDLARLRRRDEEMTRARAAKARAAEEEEARKQQRLEALRQRVAANVKVKRDPERLLQLNAAARNRRKDTSRPAGQMIARQPPRLKVPTWRQGM